MQKNMQAEETRVWQSSGVGLAWGPLAVPTAREGGPCVGPPGLRALFLQQPWGRGQDLRSSSSSVLGSPPPSFPAPVLVVHPRSSWGLGVHCLHPLTLWEATPRGHRAHRWESVPGELARGAFVRDTWLWMSS